MCTDPCSQDGGLQDMHFWIADRPVRHQAVGSVPVACGFQGNTLRRRRIGCPSRRWEADDGGWGGGEGRVQCRVALGCRRTSFLVHGPRASCIWITCLILFHGRPNFEEQMPGRERGALGIHAGFPSTTGSFIRSIRHQPFMILRPAFHRRQPHGRLVQLMLGRARAGERRARAAASNVKHTWCASKASGPWKAQAARLVSPTGADAQCDSL